jgi:hypothetical protein
LQSGQALGGPRWSAQPNARPCDRCRGGVIGGKGRGLILMHRLLESGQLRGDSLELRLRRRICALAVRALRCARRSSRSLATEVPYRISGPQSHFNEIRRTARGREREFSSRGRSCWATVCTMKARDDSRRDREHGAGGRVGHQDGEGHFGRGRRSGQTWISKRRGKCAGVPEV